MTARVDQDDVCVVEIGVVRQHREAERRRMSRERFGERWTTREYARAASREARGRFRLEGGSELQRQRQMERGADLRLTLDGDAARHQVGQLAADRQS